MEETDLKAKAKIVNDKSWKRAIKLDQKSGKKFADNLNSCISNIVMPNFQTEEFQFMKLCLVGKIKYSIQAFEKEAMKL